MAAPPDNELIVAVSVAVKVSAPAAEISASLAETAVSAVVTFTVRAPPMAVSDEADMPTAAEAISPAAVAVAVMAPASRVVRMDSSRMTLVTLAGSRFSVRPAPAAPRPAAATPPAKERMTLAPLAVTSTAPAFVISLRASEAMAFAVIVLTDRPIPAACSERAAAPATEIAVMLLSLSAVTLTCPNAGPASRLVRIASSRRASVPATIVLTATDAPTAVLRPPARAPAKAKIVLVSSAVIVSASALIRRRPMPVPSTRLRAPDTIVLTVTDPARPVLPTPAEIAKP